MLYLGTYEKKLTKRGKFCVPVKWRNESRQYVLEPIPGYTLRVTDLERFEKEEPPENPVLRRYRYSFCWTADCSKSWWIQIPESILNHLAPEDNTIWLVGIGHSFELCNREMMESMLEELREDDIESILLTENSL